MILSTYCEVWVVADQVVHQGSVVDVGWSWLYLVIPMLRVSAREAEEVQDSGRHCFGACEWRFCVLKGPSFRISAVSGLEDR